MSTNQNDSIALFDSVHPYYATEGNYFSNGYHEDYDSWDDFIADQGDADLDLNFVYRWDWNTPDPDDFAEDEEVPAESVSIFYIGQRKALAWSVRVEVARDDEPRIREWLTIRAHHVRLTWAPLLDASVETLLTKWEQTAADLEASTRNVKVCQERAYMLRCSIRDLREAVA